MPNGLSWPNLSNIFLGSSGTFRGGYVTSGHDAYLSSVPVVRGFLLSLVDADTGSLHAYIPCYVTSTLQKL